MTENKKYICYFCNKEFTTQQGLARHIKNCPNNIFKDLSNDIKEYSFTCKKCGKTFIKMMSEYSYEFLKFRNKLPKCCSKSCANSRIITNETKDKIRKGIKSFNEEYPHFNILKSRKIIKSLDDYKKLSDEDIKRYIENNIKIYKCKYCGKVFIYKKDENFSKYYCSTECKHKYLSEHTGGYRNGAGRGKSGWYKGFYCDSTWELAFLIYHLDNNLYIERCKEKRKYIFNNKEHIYIPDFITNDGIIEIKGYKTEQWLEKEKQNPDIKVIYKDDIKFYIKYVIQKYGTNFKELYDNSGNKEISLINKNISWFYKVNNDNKLYINAFVKDKNDFQYYIENGWHIGRLPLKYFKNYKNVRLYLDKTFLDCKTGKDKEIYLSSLLEKY